MMPQNVFTVSEITQKIKSLLENAFPLFWLRGEISNFKRHSSGHCYFSVKDAGAVLRCVLFKQRNRLDFLPEDGMQVLCFGYIGLYEPSGQYQLYIQEMLPAGRGLLQEKFEKLKQKLSDEGLFDELHKQPLPAFPKRVGVVTSPTGAAFQDILHVLRRRNTVDVVLAPARVQGDLAAAEIAEAIRSLNEYQHVDVIIVGRGGGSLEDLWPFNEEAVVRAIFASKIPIISAVGHEVDYTLSDYVADMRAPTPSAAAEIAVPEQKHAQEQMMQLARRMQAVLEQQQKRSVTALRQQLQRPIWRYPDYLMKQYRQPLDMMILRLQEPKVLNQQRQHIESLMQLMEKTNPLALLKRGFVVVEKEKKVVRSVQELAVTDQVDLRFTDGSVKCNVLSIEEN